MAMDAKEAWCECLELIRTRIPPKEYTDWFLPVEPEGYDKATETLTLRVPDHAYYERLENIHCDLLGRVLRHVLGPRFRLEYVLGTTRRHADGTGNGQGAPTTTQRNRYQTVNQTNTDGEDLIIDPFIVPGIRQMRVDPHLKPEYNFANFVPGECNRTAYEAGKAVVEQRGTKSAFNPLIIYGASGLGKTHLSQAIGLAIRERYPDEVVLYVRATEFMNQYAAACVTKKPRDFVNFYQNINVLIFDDVHDISTGEKTQQALLNIFNHLHQNGNQLIFTSDRALVNLNGIRAELVSRFKWGLSTELLMPDRSMRLAILKQKAYRDGIENVPDEVFEYIAQQVSTNVRELEGVLVSVMAYSTFNRQGITVELAERVISDIVQPRQQEAFSVARIAEIVANYFSLTVEEIQSPTRRREIVEARQIAMYMAKKFTKRSLSYIGQEMGGKNHATVSYACTNIHDLCRNNAKLRSDVEAIESLIRGEL